MGAIPSKESVNCSGDSGFPSPRLAIVNEGNSRRTTAVAAGNLRLLRKDQ